MIQYYLILIFYSQTMETLCMDNIKILVPKKQVSIIIEKLSKDIFTQFENKKLVIFPAMNGAAYLSTKLSKKIGQLGLNHCYHPIYSSSHEGPVKMDKPKLFFGDIMKYKDFEILIFDELFNTGNTFFITKKILVEEYGFDTNKIFTCSIFIKDKKVILPLPNFFGIKIHDVWTVGCGIDNNGYSRYLKDLYALPKPIDLSRFLTEHDIMFEDVKYYEKMFKGGLYICRTKI